MKITNLDEFQKMTSGHLGGGETVDVVNRVKDVCATVFANAANVYGVGSFTTGIAGERYQAGVMLVFRPGDRITVTSGELGARLILLGGATLEGPRYIWWNFVSSSNEKIEAAKKDWAAGEWEKGRFQLPFGDADEFIPLPDK